MMGRRDRAGGDRDKPHGGELIVGFLQSNGLWAGVSADDAGDRNP